MGAPFDVSSRPPRIGFVVWPQRGHIYPTLHLAKRLRERGADVVYFGGESARALVEEQGFAFVAVIPEAGSPEIPSEHNREIQHAFLARVVQRFAGLLRERQVTHLFVDPLYHLATLSALSAGVDVKHFWVMNPPHRRGRNRPFGLSFGLHNSPLARLAPQLLWIPEMIRSGAWIARYYPRRVASNRLIATAATRHQLGPLVLTSYGYQLDLPTIVFGPEALAHSRERGCTYLGLGVEESRSEPAAAVSGKRKVVYCSLGTDFALYDNAARIVGEVVRAAEKMGDVDFVIQAPRDGLPRLATGPNVTLVERAPTLKILAHASAAITHGGYGSMKECIFYRVPSLAIPFLYDQPANAVLLTDHGLGLTLTARRTTADRIRTALRRLMEEEAFARALAALRTQALAEDRYDRFCDQLFETGVPR